LESPPKGLQNVSPSLGESGDGVYEFGACRLETAERLLLRAGERVALTPKAFDTLLILVQSNGHLVRKHDLMQQLWPDAVVEEANLARNVWAIRKALGEREGEQAYIETIPKIGYRFVAPVSARPAELVRPAAVPSVQVRFRQFVPAALAVSIIAIVIVGFWAVRTAPPAAAFPVESGITFLTDGSHDDTAASWGSDGKIFFSRDINDARIETWTMGSDGSDQRRANTDIKSLLVGRWSPDGKRVIFTKEGISGTAYLADADGGHEVALPFLPGNLDWSPDSSQFVYQASIDGSHQLVLYTIATGKSLTLTSSSCNADPSFSPDGTRIAFTSWRDGNAEIYVMNADGSHVRRITNHPSFDNYPVFSPDGTQLAFQSNREDEHVQIYLQDLDDDRPPIRLSKSTSLTGLAPKCWSPDGTRMLVYTNRSGKDQIAVLSVEPFPARLLLSDPSADLSFPHLSQNGRELLYQARAADRSLELRLMDLATKSTRRLYATAPDYPHDLNLSPAWSPDGTLIAFSARADGNSEILAIKPDGTGLRNLTRNPLLDAMPAFSADSREIIFSRDAFGQAQLYRMDTNGGGQRRVTGAAGYEMSPAASLDGRHLVFAGDRTSRGLDILSLDLLEPGHERVLAARRGHDNMPAFSPDGSHIVFIATSDGNAEIYMMKADGTGLVRITHTVEDETSPQFAGGGRQIIFSRKNGDKLALYQSEVR